MTTTYAYDPHSLDEMNKTPSNRSFGLTVGLILLAIALFPMLKGGAAVRPLAIIAGSLIVLALIFPRILTWPNIFWMKLGLLLNMIVAPIVIGSIYYLFVTPYALLLRMTGKKFLALEKDDSAKTYWVVKDPKGPPADGMRNQF